ncbi:MAG: 1-(5-phosphoribosyl)-5-[(5-phosphoribosylamino)methylideneamino]imidazole-4-carboxamide isomerase [Chloroflexi bacterium]|nr:1-(5-phosphoribosyl)-5-[(5-phosphoribosylamino)methylideneamino]imidazole-4-carboxamide isomerase [Chloroflexota bacterium]
MTFQIIPAIDLLGGRAVRLAQGDFDRQIWSEDAVVVARRWSAAGAQMLHVVDLDGAAKGAPVELPTLVAIRAVTDVAIEYSGGLRSDESVAAAFAAGANRVVLGTALGSRPEWVAQLCLRYGDRIVAGIDARGGRVAVQGWLESSALSLAEIVRRSNAMGVSRAIVTDIEKDGMLGGPNLDMYRSVLEEASFEVIASGGISSLEDIEAVRGVGTMGAIIGQALYTGHIDLRVAIEMVAA